MTLRKKPWPRSGRKRFRWFREKAGPVRPEKKVPAVVLVEKRGNFIGDLRMFEEGAMSWGGTE